MNRIFFLLSSFIVALTAAASTPYTWTNLSGSARPYPDSIGVIEHPDSLTPVMITHISRHGARYPTSELNVDAVRNFLMKAYGDGQLTPKGMSLLSLADSVCTMASGKWGRLDALGEAEQRGIAGRLYESAPALFVKGARIMAMSSWKPRCVMSMYTFIHQLTLLNDKGLDVTAISGSARCDTLLRFFDTDKAYKELKKSDSLANVASYYEAATIDDATATELLKRLAGNSIPPTISERRRTAVAIYSLIAGCGAMGIEVLPDEWMTYDEFFRCWASKDVAQYLKYSVSGVSRVPAEMASPLLKAIIGGIDGFIGKEGVAPVQLYFGHAETLMPLMSLMRLPRAYYVAPDIKCVPEHWHNFDIVPMAANLTFTLFRSNTGELYVRLDVNGSEEPLIPGSGIDYVEWNAAREYLESCLAVQ